MALLRLAGRRLALAVPGLLGVIVVTFLLNRALPGDPAAFFAGPAATRQAIEEIRARLGLDKSVPEQFVYYVDRKSTRLNSSHSQISYAVFCLKKKKKNRQNIQDIQIHLNSCMQRGDSIY